MVTSFFVVTRILSNPLSNVFQKKLTSHSASPVFIILITHTLLSLGMLPVLFQIFPVQLGISFFANMFLCVFLAIAGNTLIVAALQLTDLSILGPVNAYKSVVSLVLGIFLLGEIPTLMGALGILLILAGSYFFVDQRVSHGKQNAFLLFIKDKGIRLRFAALVLAATEAVFLKKALLLASPLITFVFWCIMGTFVALVFGFFLSKTGFQSDILAFRQRTSTFLLLALTTGLMQFSTLYTFGVLQVGYSLALFQTSALLSVFFGYKFFREQNVLQRLLGASIMVAGAILIVVFGIRS